MRPEVGELCAAAENAFNSDEFEDALLWYELACASTYMETWMTGAGNVVPHPQKALIDRRFERYEELRQMVPWRSVRLLARPDPHHLMIVMTCAGREQLFDCMLRSLQAAGGSSWTQIVKDEHRDGQAKTFFRALQRAAKYDALTQLTLFEDDVILARSAADYIALYKPDPDLVLTSWFTVETCSVPRLPPVLSCIPVEEYMFNQAITMSAATVHALLASDAVKNWSEPHGADRIYRDVFSGKKCALHFPSIVQHVGGAESLVGNNDHGLRTSPTFVGEDFDALSLIR